MGELSDAWASDGKKNIFGNILSVTEMESETGAAGEGKTPLSAVPNNFSPQNVL